MIEPYNKHTWKKVIAVVLFLIAFIFLIALFGYQSGNPGFLSLGSALEQGGGGGQMVAELIIVVIVFIATFILVYYFTLTNISQQLTDIKDITGVAKINPSKELKAKMRTKTQLPSNNYPGGSNNYPGGSNIDALLLSLKQDELNAGVELTNNYKRESQRISNDKNNVEKLEMEKKKIQAQLEEQQRQLDIQSKENLEQFSKLTQGMKNM